MIISEEEAESGRNRYGGRYHSHTVETEVQQSKVTSTHDTLHHPLAHQPIFKRMWYTFLNRYPNPTDKSVDAHKCVFPYQQEVRVRQRLHEVAADSFPGSSTSGGASDVVTVPVEGGSRGGLP